MNLDGFTAANISEIRKGLVLCQELEETLKRGIACGQDCQEMWDRCQMAKQQLTQMNQIYGPQYLAKQS